MGARQKDWARRTREKMLDELGRECVWCKKTEADGVKLTFDCIVPQGDAHHRKDQSARVSFYRAQLRADNIQILCESCNSKKGDEVIRFIPPRLNFAHMGEFAPF